MTTRPQDDPRFAEGVRLFNARAYYEAHEVWEDLWREEVGDFKRFLHGLIQVAAALYRLDANDPGKAITLLKLALEKLDGAKGAYGTNGVEVREAARDVLLLLRAGEIEHARARMPDLHAATPP